MKHEIKCDCIEQANKILAPKHLMLKTETSINMQTGQMAREICLQTVSLKRGVRAHPMRMAFCPFCGKTNLQPPTKS